MADPRVAVVGAGAWGTTLARLIGRTEPVILVCHSPETAARIVKTGRNDARLPGIYLPPTVGRLARRRFRLYVNEDILGVELCGALKNVVAIAAGAADALGFGDNGKAGLLTRGLAEMTRLGIVAGANPLTFAGLAGMGDLIATCGSNLSRNHRLGVELAKGRAWADIEGTLPGTAEGAYTVQAALALAGRLGVEMPIAREVERALFEGKSVQRCLVDLLARESKDELADLDRWMARLGKRPAEA